jgi:copper(I)-binding protein
MKRSFALLLALGLSAVAARAAGSAVSVSGAWSRPASDTAVVYATLHNSGSTPDRLIGASSSAATHVGLHQSYEMKMNGGSMSGMAMSGPMVGMKSVASIPVPAGGTTTLKPGGYHLMVDLKHAVKAGDAIPLRLHFANAGWIDTTVPVKPIQ